MGSGRMSSDGFELEVHVRPGGRRNAVEGTHDGVLAVRVSAPPADGKANEAVRRVLAEAFGVRPGAVAIVSGTTNRRKRVRITGDPDAIARCLRELADGGESGP